VEVGNGCPAISREEEVEEPHDDADKDCESQLAIKVKRFPDLDNLEADDANDVDDDDGLPRGFSTSTTTPLPPPSRTSSSSSTTTITRNLGASLPQFRGNPPAVSASSTSPPTPHSPSRSIPTSTPKHTSPTPSSSSPHPASSSPSSPHAASASTEFKRRMSSLTGQIREASLSEMPPLRRFLNRGISNIKEHVGHFLGGEPLVAVARHYTRLHKQLLGEYPLGMPPRPKNEQQLEELDKNFVELLKEHDLLSLIPVFVLCPVVFSYHFLLEVPALYGLWWYHPERVTALIDLRKGTLMLPRYTVLRCGWQALWARIVEVEGLNVHLNAKVKSIRRPGMGKRGQLVVGGGEGGGVGEQAGGNTAAPRQETHEFDLLVLACSLQSVLPLLVDATEGERELAGALTEYTLYSTIFEADSIMGERPVELYPFPKRGAAMGQVFAQVNPRLLVRTPAAAAAAASPRGEQQQEEDSNNNHHEARLHSGSSSSSSSAKKDPRIVYQFLERAPKPADVAMLTRRLKMYFDDQSFHELTVLKQCLWKFFPHFSNDALIKGGWLWRLQEMQGQQGTLYLGASAGMDALNEVLLYNEAALGRVLGL